MNRYHVARPFSLFESFDRDLDRFFAPENSKEKRWKPFSRVEEEENHYHLALDIPGVDKEHLKVELKENVLSISGERKDHIKKDNGEFRSYGSFEQSWSLPQDANLSEIEVSQHNGVLDVVIPKALKQKESKSIDIKSGLNKFLG